MTRAVVDASVALSWCFVDETNAYADAVLVQLRGGEIHVPSIWSVEVANGIVVGERHKRINPADSMGFVQWIDGLSVFQDVVTLGEAVSRVLPLAREHQLTAYDAAYLELALRKRLPLATLDRRLAKAAMRAGVGTFPAKR